MNPRNRSIRLSLDRLSAAHGKRQAADLVDRCGPAIPEYMLAAARLAFIEGVRRAIADAGLPGDPECLVTEFTERRDAAFEIELRRRQRRASTL